MSPVEQRRAGGLAKAGPIRGAFLAFTLVPTP
jgi:hypothetical protein